MKHHPAWERMYLSVLFLAKGRANLRERLEGVYQNQLLALFERDFLTREQRDKFAEIVISLKGLESLSEDEQAALAEKIVDLYNDCVESQYED